MGWKRAVPYWVFVAGLGLNWGFDILHVQGWF